MSKLQVRLQAALGDAYRIERELGGGGMSRVFLATEAALKRRVAIKVLPPEMAASVNIERFRREIELAASLQHPNIVPLLSAGASGDLLYYTMPLIEGESLRARLAREGELPVAETIRILTDVADALAYAHARDIVHRDVKPDNVLLSGKHALVTDFGVAKAVSASSGGSLTSLGVALGTPAYMAPEQAAADPHVDRRADLYALGVLGYEMLTGRPPFTGATPQATLAAQVTKKPEPVTAHREAIPGALNALVMRCLEKHPADRWQSGAEMLQQLEAMATPSGGMTPTGEALPLSSGTRAALRHAHPLRVGGWFALAALGVLAAVDVLVRGLGLPDWVLYAAVGLLGIGLPIMLVTGLVERRRILASTGRIAASRASGLSAWLNWRKATLGGVMAFAGLGLVTTVYMAMRLLGIGPVGTLIASGVLKERQPIVLASFENRTADSALGPALAEAFRVDLSQSPSVKLLDPKAVGDALQRMLRAAGTPLDLALARELAQREGVTAVVTGVIDPVGSGYQLSASLVAAGDGRVLTAVRETAADDRALIGAVDRLTRKLRERIGESLITIRANAPLEKVTTASLEALRRYSQAVRADDEGDVDRAMTLLEQATALDTAFAMAYRKLAVELDNSNAGRTLIVDAVTRAFAHRERLPELEGHLATAYYYSDADYDPPKGIVAYRAVLELDPDNTIALNNLALSLNNLRRWPEAETLAVHAMRVGRGYSYYFNAMTAQVAQGHFADAQATLERLARASPKDATWLPYSRAMLASARHDYATAEREFRTLRTKQPASAIWQALTSSGLAELAEVRGKLAEAGQYLRDYMAASEQRGLARDYLLGATNTAWLNVRYRNKLTTARRTVEAALARHPLSSIPAFDRPYLDLAFFYARAGWPERAKRLIAEFESTVPEPLRRSLSLRYAAAGAVAFAEKRTADALAAYRNWFEEGRWWVFGCTSCGLFDLAGVYEAIGEPDSALALYERIVATPGLIRLFDDYATLVPTYRRLGELYEARGNRAKAREYYGRFADLWKDADPELQPTVADARAALKRLSASSANPVPSSAP